MTSMPCRCKRSVLRLELDTAARKRVLCLASSSIKKSTVEPVPTPTTAVLSSRGKMYCTASRATFCFSSSCVSMAASREKFGVASIGKTHHNRIARNQHGAFDQRGVLGNQRQPLGVGGRSFLVVVKHTPRGGRFVDQCAPAQRSRPLLQHTGVDGFITVINKRMVNALTVQPLTCFDTGTAAAQAKKLY